MFQKTSAVEKALSVVIIEDENPPLRLRTMVDRSSLLESRMRVWTIIQVLATLLLHKEHHSLLGKLMMNKMAMTKNSMSRWEFKAKAHSSITICPPQVLRCPNSQSKKGPVIDPPLSD